MIWNVQKECMSSEEKHELQSARLRKLVNDLYHNSPFYRQKLQELDILPGDIRSIDDITRLPFTTKDDLRTHYPYGLFSVPMTKIIRLHASSGTTGNPTVVGYTRHDLTVWAETVARCLSAYGADHNDIFSVAYGYGLFTGGLGLHYGIENIGATVVPTSSGNTAKHIRLIHDLGITALACTPSYALYMADMLNTSADDRHGTRLRLGIFGAEPWTENMRREIEEKLGIKAYNIYGLSEIMGPGVAHECEYRNGSHIIDDHFYPEIVDPETLRPLPDGRQGELVITTLTKEGMPLLRYRTKDLCSLTHEKCECGRTSTRISRIAGRSDDMLIVRGVNVFPSQIEGVILETGELEPHYRIIVDRKDNRDEMTVEVERRRENGTGNVATPELQSKTATRLHDILGINATVRIVPPDTIQRCEGKTKRVIDNRKLH